MRPTLAGAGAVLGTCTCPGRGRLPPRHLTPHRFEMERKWSFRKPDRSVVGRISAALGLSPLTAQVLVNRGYSTEAEVKGFLEGTLFDLPSPFLLKGMAEAVDRLVGALLKGDKIAVYGDYDVDGVTSTALLYSFLRRLGADVVYYLPDRVEEGYGVNALAVGKRGRLGVRLVVSCDCGITAAEEVERARRMGVDFIITDHHEPPERLPAACAVIDPHQQGCTYPDKAIAGVGVVFNLLMGLRRTLRERGFFRGRKEPNLGDYLDLVALGTVADCAPLVGVNRILVREGLRRIAAGYRPGVEALKRVSGVGERVRASDLSFRLGPRLNAAGRLASARAAVELLVTVDPVRARRLAEALNADNARRQAAQSTVVAEARAAIGGEASADAPVLVAASTSWHPGVIGIAASRLAAVYGRPVVLVAVGEDGLGRGSARSVEGVDIYDVLRRCGEGLFVKFGGHEQAAGFSIRGEDVELLRERLVEALRGVGEQCAPVLEVDAVCALHDVGEPLVEELAALEPFGEGNAEPVFAARSVRVEERRVLKENHLLMGLASDGSNARAVWFDCGFVPAEGEVVDVAFTPEVDTWGGRSEVRLRVMDVRPAAPSGGAPSK